MSIPPSNTKAIVVGGGPVGLVAAHALTHAGLDFVLLESRPNIVIDAGSNLVLLPMSLRSLYQLGLQEAIKSVTSELGTLERFDHKGIDIGSLNIFNHFERLTGALPRVVSRHDLTKVLFEALPKESQDKVLTNKRVSTIIEGPDGLITVSCRDETSYIGNYVVGSDGAHSIVRDQMRNLALASGSLAVNKAQPFETAYRCLWMRIPSSTSDALKPGMSAETHGIGCATQLFAGEETTVVGVYEKLEKPTKERMRFTPADEDALIEKWGHLVLLADRQLTLRQVYEKRIQSGLVSLEEGVVDHWSWDGRIVLAGDAAHKFTPSGGAGCNNGIVDVIALANEVARTMEEVGMNPSKTQLSQAFDRYQALRYPLVSMECKDSGDATAMAIWSTGTLRFVDRHVLPNTMFQRISSRDAAKATADTPAFNYIAGTDVILGKIPWTKPMGEGAQS